MTMQNVVLFLETVIVFSRHFEKTT